MKNNKNKIRYITILAAIIAILSVGIGYSSYTNSNESSGTSELLEGKYDIKIDKIHTVITSNTAVTFKQEPTITGKEISFSIANFIPNTNASFEFDIRNEGNIPIKIKNIKITGLDNYENNITYTISNIKVGDIIKPESVIKDNQFILKYKQAILNENGENINLDLDNLTLTIEFEKSRE